MVIVFGWGQGEAQDRGEVVPIVCPNCHNQVWLHEIQSQKQVSLYFVPMASYGSDVYLACPICRHGLQVDPAHRSAVDAMVAATRMARSGQLAPDAYRGQAERFLAQMGMASPDVPATGARTATQRPPTSSAPGGSFVDRLEGLGRLHATGVLTDEEFAAAKRRLLEPDAE